jgi:hypothetical protein
VRNKTRLEISMLEGYALEEALGFCIKYLQDFAAISQKVWDEKEDVCMNDKVLQRNGRARIMSANFWDMAHSFVPQNVDLMSTWHM